jgi:hypothetical protein
VWVEVLLSCQLSVEMLWLLKLIFDTPPHTQKNPLAEEFVAIFKEGVNQLEWSFWGVLLSAQLTL